MTYKGNIQSVLSWSWTSGTSDNDKLSYSQTLTDGTGVNQAEAVWHKESIVLLSGNSTTYDLTNLIRTVLGDATHSTTFVTIKAIHLVNLSTSGGELHIGGAATNEWSEMFAADGDKLVIPLDSANLWSSRRCGKEVDGTNKNLKVAAVGGDVTYSIAIVGLITPATGECSSSA